MYTTCFAAHVSNVASVPGLPRSRTHIYLRACGTQIVGQEQGTEATSNAIIAIAHSNYVYQVLATHAISTITQACMHV